jgi:hypothetical protein
MMSNRSGVVRNIWRDLCKPAYNMEVRGQRASISSSSFGTNSITQHQSIVVSSFSSQKVGINSRKLHSSMKILKNGEESKDVESSSVIDGLEASSAWKRGQLSKLSDKFEDKLPTMTDDNGNNNNDKGNRKEEVSEVMEINTYEEVQQMWKDMESRVTRRRTMTLSEAKINGKVVGRKNLRKTDEEAWLEAGLYHKEDHVDK